jgi:hypothetical protein
MAREESTPGLPPGVLLNSAIPSGPATARRIISDGELIHHK